MSGDTIAMKVAERTRRMMSGRPHGSTHHPVHLSNEEREAMGIHYTPPKWRPIWYLYVLWAVVIILGVIYFPRIQHAWHVHQAPTVLARNRGRVTQLRMKNIKDGVRAYWEQHYNLPPPENTAIAAAIGYTNRVDRKGRMLDAYYRPFVFTYATNQMGRLVRIRSYGRDKKDDQGKYDDLLLHFLLEYEKEDYQ